MILALIICICILAYLFYKKGVMDTEDTQKEKDRYIGYKSPYHKMYDKNDIDFSELLNNETAKYELQFGSSKFTKLTSLVESRKEYICTNYYVTKFLNNTFDVKSYYIEASAIGSIIFENNKTHTIAVLWMLMMLNVHLEGLLLLEMANNMNFTESEYKRNCNIINQKSKRLAIEALNYYK